VVAPKHHKHVDRPGTEALNGKQPGSDLVRIVFVFSLLDCRCSFGIVVVVVAQEKVFREAPVIKGTGNRNNATALGPREAGGFL